MWLAALWVGYAFFLFAGVAQVVQFRVDMARERDMRRETEETTTAVQPA